MASQCEPIAVVGSGCRFPGGSNSPSSLWELLVNPCDIQKEIPTHRFNVQGYYHPDAAHHGTTNVKHAYLLDQDVRDFDAGFFNISRKEADSMDPQQRLLMETVYEALESGGHTIMSLRGTDTAVYVGVMGNDYECLLMRDVDNIPTYTATGTSRAILSNRISYFFDWHGPSLTIDTACSSSLIAVHQGVQALRTTESRVAVACGTTMILGPDAFVAESKLNMLSPTGRSQMWDANADGYARGEGVAVVILKRLSDAIADGDHIESVIRATGTNQDGRSAGLTVPSSQAQVDLIRQTYSKAGLDPRNFEDRPQFFEAHGTGTKAGDPREAEAIHRCFGPKSTSCDMRSGQPLYVGSVKTVIGHTEGAAGLAGLLKASLAIQHGLIPPNLLFNRLNPSIEPFYGGLEIPTKPVGWPTLPEGVPRRASVNSFGFGGANAHVILESYQTPASETTPKTVEATDSPFTPFTFSAATEASLVSLLDAYSKVLKTRKHINLRDLAWTLQTRKSAHAIKTTLSARTADRLVSKIDDLVEKMRRSDMKIHNVRSVPTRPRILGVFTGQGAQWATMGACLIRSSTFVRERLALLDTALASLPESDRPNWRLQDEILADQKSSRLGEAELSQPLSTAIQLVVIDLLQVAGITFEAVVGHSSGEIACAYAADFISAHDAIRIAYYRGLHAKLAGSPGGHLQKAEGAMLAVGTSWDDAKELIDLPAFAGRLSIAAHNSSASVTLSGDLGAISHAKMVFDEEKKFSRLLKVNVAYHSHHMLLCAESYIRSLQACGITVKRERNTSCTWYSSVFPGGRAMGHTEALQDVYWKDNMVNTVLFSAAIKNAGNEEKELNFALEVGPHPALKGPASQNISEVRAPLPYCGVLSRGEDDIEALSDALGFIWAQLGTGSVNFQAYEDLMSDAGGAPPKFVLGLPLYQWNHERSHWHESRRSKESRMNAGPFHELLGTESPDSTDRDRRWRNVLKASEIRWLDGHALQGQTVFPAAGYIGMAIESAKKVAGDRDISLFEIRDFVIDKAISFEDDANFAVETLVTLTSITPPSARETIQLADFTCYSCANNGSVGFDIVATGKVTIFYGTPLPTTLSSIPLAPSNMNEVDEDVFYASTLELGYQYTGSFRGMSCIKRKMHQATALVSTYASSDDETPLIIHPAPLDIAIQSLMVAYSHPEDQGMRTLHVPTSIGCIRINPELCAALPTSQVQLPICAVIHEGQDRSICGSFDLFSEDGQHTLVQAEDLAMKPLTPATSDDDRRLFTHMKWGFESPNANYIVGDDSPSAEEIELAMLCERMSYFYLQKWNKEITEEEWTHGQEHHRHLKSYVDHTLSLITRGEHPWIKREWSGDTFDDIKPTFDRYAESVDAKMIKAVGENMAAVVRGETTMIEHIVKDNMMNDMYVHGLGFSKYSSYLATMVQQLVHRYPNSRILEIGAGTGGTTKQVLRAIGDTFSSYTFTDISEGFFENAAEILKVHNRKMAYRVFDVERPPAAQGFEAHSYDVVIAANVLHATSSLDRTLEHTRQLLKPGGHLILFEITQTKPLRFTNLTAGLPGWWNARDGRTHGPLVTPHVWHAKLRKAGFSGVDAITPMPDTLTWPYSVIATQAINDQVDYLRRPLALSCPLSSKGRFQELVIVGARSLETSRIADDLADLLRRFCDRLVIIPGLPTEADAPLSPMTTTICLADMDDAVFNKLDEKKMDGLKRVYESSKNIIWVTRGAQADDPYQMASIGFGRALKHEKPYLTLTHLDLPRTSKWDHKVPKVIAETLLRQCALEEWQIPHGNHAYRNLLWSQEPELLMENGLLMIPRYIATEDQNARINSLRRPITRTVRPSDCCVVGLSQNLGDWPPSLQEDVLHVPAAHDDHRGLIRPEQSMLVSMNTGRDTFLYLSVGVDKATQEEMVALSSTVSSEMKPLASLPLKPSVKNKFTGFLAAVASELMAMVLVSTLSPMSKLLVHEPGEDHYFANALTRRAAVKSVRVAFTTSSGPITTDEDAFGTHKWTRLEPWMPTHLVRNKIPADLTHFLDLETTLETGSLVSRSIDTALPSACRRLAASDIFRSQGNRGPVSDDRVHDLVTLMQDAIAAAQEHVEYGKFSSDQIIPLDRLAETPAPRRPSTTIVDWTWTEALTVQVQPLDASRLFSRDKTYILVGLTGQIGQSLCEWMVRSGAGCVCLTSRRPMVNAQWLESFHSTDTKVKVFAMDVSNKQDVKQVVEEIRATCPPIAGVGNGAMVLEDVLFSDMSLDQMQQVLKPKIDGTNHLVEIFQDKEELDFFIMFSSVSSIVGNPGQSNYAAACAYMQSLANLRRKAGLAASTFDIGRVVGIGYVERADPVVKEQLIKFRYMPISEDDFHQLFAETIRAGNPAVGACPVVTTAISATTDEREFRPHWFDDARFSHCIVVNDDGDKTRRDGLDTSLPVMEQLSGAASFAAKLRVILQITDHELDRYTPVIEHGIDSLVAVEVRSWFVKELKVDMPVLKILGGASIADLSEQALKGLPETVLSSIGAGVIEGAGPVSAAITSYPAKKSILSPEPGSPASGSATDSNPLNSTTDNEAVASGSSPGDSNSDTSAPEPVEVLKFENHEVASVDIAQSDFLRRDLLSFAQARFWYLRLLLKDQTTFTVAFFYKITGTLRIGDLERAVKAVAARHEVLRTWFMADQDGEGDMARQNVARTSKLRLEHKKINTAADVAAEYAALREAPLLVEKGEHMRLILLTLGPSSHFLLVSYHHILMDGVGFQIFMTDLEKAYKGQSMGISPRPMTYFSTEQRKAYESGRMNEALEFWRNQFPDEPPVLPLLPFARVTSRMPMSAFNVQQAHRRLDPELAARVKLMSKAARSTPFHFYLAAYKAMLLRFAEVDDLTIGIADANRGDGEAMKTVGLFLNLLTLRFRREPAQKFNDAITEARDATYKALAHSSLPFDVLLQELSVPRSSLHSPLFQAFFDFRQGAQERHLFGNCEFEIQEAHPGRTAYDIVLDVTDSASGTLVAIRTQRSIYDETATKLLLDTYIEFVQLLSKDTSLVWDSVPLFSANQLEGALDLGRGPDLAPEWPETLPHRIDQVAEHNSDRIAIMDGRGGVLTYNGMIQRIQAISEALIHVGMGAGSRVLVFQEAACDWVCSMLAIMRIGSIYVPLDIRNPLQRLAGIANDCQPDGILVDATTARDSKHVLSGLPGTQRVRLIEVSSVPCRPSSSPMPVRATADSVGAILYTSGSTGKPKGILVKHSGLRNEIEGYTKQWRLGERTERVLQQSAFSFNHSSDQIYTALTNGGMLYVVPSDQRGDPLEITKLIKKYDISYTKATPSEYALWLQYGFENLRQASQWRFAFGGGETLTSTILQRFKELRLPQLRFFNSYGPTEVSISSHKMEIPYQSELPGAGDRIPCGYSLPNYVTYILDENLQPVPPGMSGEICIGGAGVSLGYLNDSQNKELDAGSQAAFLPNPYATAEDIAKGWTRMYRTGDIGHLRAEDGAMVFHSRIAGDTQIKIRGLRIELADIESNIVAASNGVLREAVVTLRVGDPDYLVAHVVFAPSQHGRIARDQKHRESFLQNLLGRLPIPQYMVPVLAVPLDSLPLTSHSKVDRAAVARLPLPPRTTLAANGTGGGEAVVLTKTMKLLKEVWDDVLGNRKPGGPHFDLTPATSIFSVGGNSLLMIRLQSRIRAEFHVVIRLVDLLGANTLGEMANIIDESVGVQSIDWEEETALPDLHIPGLPAGNLLLTKPIHTDHKTILLTGATGYLAKYLIPRLMASHRIAKIICIAVRRAAVDGNAAQEPHDLDLRRPLSETSYPKIITHAGDLTQPRLGLSEDVFAALATEVDLVLHMGASRSFWDNYHTLRAVNVNATKELVRLAAARHVPIHYISSAGVFPRQAVTTAVADSAAAHLPSTDGSDGYVASRWASERVLERASKTLGLATLVHRFVPASHAGRPNREDEASKKVVLDEFRRFIDLSKLTPDLTGWTGRVDMMPAEEAVAGVFHEVLAERGDRVEKTRFTHHLCDISLEVAELRTMVTGHKFVYDQMKGLQWVGRIKALGFGYLFATQEVAVRENSVETDDPSEFVSRR